jgi:glycosyltransferase involved in cell wall biosynthesis
MKILMVNKFLYPRGGSESYMLKLGDCLKKLGHQVEYFGMYDDKNTVSNSQNITTKNMDFHSSAVSRYLYPFKIIYSFEANKKIGQVIDEFKPDIVHMNNINFQLTPSIIYAVKKRGIPLVQTVHDYQMICPNHLFYSFGENKPCERCLEGSKLNCIKYNCIHDSKVKSILGVVESKLYSFLKTYKKVDLYVCPSYFLENKLLSSIDIYKGKTYTIHNFIEKKTDYKILEDKEPYIVFVGRLSKEKGVELLAETAKLLPQYKFLVVGSGPDEGVLHNIPNVVLTGFLTGQALTDTMANAKILLAPSVCYENCPLSILEAHSMGVPVVTMNSGGMAELVKDGVTGSLVQAPTAQSVAQTIVKTLDNEEYYNSLKQNCENEWENIADVESYCENLIGKYKELINRR